MGKPMIALLRSSCILAILAVASFSFKEDNGSGPDAASSALEDAFALASQNANLKCLIVYNYLLLTTARVPSRHMHI